MIAVISLLAPYALLASALLAIPIIVHLLKPRKVRETPYSSLRWLHLTRQHLTRRIRWHQFLLFLLRATFIILLVFALARPLFSTTQEGKPAERFIVLDISRSMKYKQADRPSAMETARDIAVQIAQQALPEDRTALLLTGNRTEVACPLGQDTEACLSALAGVQAGNMDTDLGSALPIIGSMLSGCRPGVEVKIVFITDNYQNNWNQSAISSFLQDSAVPPTIKVIDIGPTSPQNAWIAGARYQPGDKGAPAKVRVQLGCVGDDSQERTVRLTGLSSVPERERKVQLEAGRLVEVEFDLAGESDIRGKIASLQLEPADRLPEDDRYWLPLDPGGSRVLIVEADSPRKGRFHPAFPLRTAVEVLSKESKFAWQPVSKNHREVAAGDIEAADVVFLADVPELPEPARQALEERVHSGGGLAIFLGPRAQPAYYNTKLFHALQPATGLMPFTLKSAVPADNRLAPLTGVAWNHPIFANMLDPIVGDLGQAQFRFFYTIAGTAAKNATLAWIDQKVPAIVEHAVNAGKVLILNTTPDTEWSDLARRASFVPLVDRMLGYLSGGGARRHFLTGEEIALLVDKLPAGENATVTTPSGASLTPSLKTSAERTSLRLSPQNEPGIYQVKLADKTISFVVQVGPGDSVLSPMDQTVLKQWWQPAGVEIVKSEAGAASLPAERFPLWPILLVLASVLLLTEAYIATRLCPRATPAVAHGIVHRHGLLAASPKTASSGRGN